ncbi:hypothetical protein RvY_19429 [Ramazzottius varieornatus]|uniref:DDE Tnp4 domain-containing protein n=1 Tax=Ramazzottius varieornatus TaxID=947166 RepID=A0A1D1W9C1_RAMVA|nr:hypothetical protein RvY_19429 [Ramazzottius varieornatus]
MDKKLLVAMCEEGDIDEEELVHLSQLSEQAKMRPGDFDLDTISNQVCLEDFRFSKSQLFLLQHALEIPDIMYTDSHHIIPGMEALCLLLKRLAFPNRLCDLEKIFGRNRTVLSRCFNHTLKYVHDKFCGRLETPVQPWIDADTLELWAQAVSRKGSPYDRCVGFIDGTNIEICRPSDYATQKICYTGYKKEHDLKYTGVMAPCGIMFIMCGPEPGSFHDAKLLYRSQILTQLRESPIWTPTLESGFYLYGDQAYKSTPQVIGPIRFNASPLELACNAAMKTLRVSVEWGFGKIGTLFAFNNYPEDLKLGVQPLGMYFKVSTLLTNCHTCLNGSQTSNHFSVEPPTLLQYLENYPTDDN